MNLKELEEQIEILGLSKYKYNLGNKPMSELELGLLRKNNKWQVYQSFEKGGYNIIRTFNNESDACNLILSFLKLDKKKDAILNL